MMRKIRIISVEVITGFCMYEACGNVYFALALFGALFSITMGVVE